MILKPILPYSDGFLVLRMLEASISYQVAFWREAEIYAKQTSPQPS
jgi:hypothetical protein